MNCIDAIEGTVKHIIIHIFNQYVTFGQDDTEFILNVKSVIEGTEEFVLKNSDIINNPKTLKTVLYDLAKELWLQHLKKQPAPSIEGSPSQKQNEADEDGYYEYYYDHIYHHGVYPR